MERKATVTTKQQLLTACWSNDVQKLETAIGKFAADRSLKNDCGVMFFEMEGDRELHVNVTHRHQTSSASGWSGPASMAEGFVHNRCFAPASPALIARHIRAMVFAAKV